MSLAEDAASAFRPGLWALAALVVILIVATLLAKRERDRAARITSELPEGAWSAPCLDATTSATKRVLILGDDGIALVETGSGSRDEWPWDDVVSVSTHRMRSRVGRYPGVRLRLADGHERDLLVYLGNGKQSYEQGAIQALMQVRRRHPDKLAQ